jgi:hypothetical protein
VENVNTEKRNKEALVDASRKVSVEVKGKRTSYMSMSYHQNIGQSHTKMVVNKSFQNGA